MYYIYIYYYTKIYYMHGGDPCKDLGFLLNITMSDCDYVMRRRRHISPSSLGLGEEDVSRYQFLFFPVQNPLSCLQ